MAFVTTAQRYDVLCVGDVSTDEFIRLPEGSARRRDGEDGAYLELPLGGKVPYERGTTVAAGGSAANGALALARLGLRVGLATFVAHDAVGLDLLSALRAEHVDTHLVRVDEQVHTNRNFVLSFHGERTILVRHEAFDYHWPHLRPSEVPSWIFLTSLGPDALEYQDAIAEWLDAVPEVRLALYPGRYQLEAGSERLQRLYRRAEVLVCPASGARVLAGGVTSDPASLLEPLLGLGPRTVVVADGRGGAVAGDGTDRFLVEPFPDTSAPLDRTGADDTFAATVVAGLVHGLALPVALAWPTVNFMSVSHQLGAQAGLLRLDDLEAQLSEAGAGVAARRF